MSNWFNWILNIDQGEKDDANREEDGNDRYSNKYNDLVGFKYVNSDSDDEEEYEVIGQDGNDIKVKNSNNLVKWLPFSEF